MSRKVLCVLLSFIMAVSIISVGTPKAAYAAVESFFAPAQSSGSMTVKLYPMENVSSGATKLVTFGIPFTRGSMTVSGLSKVRVLKGGTEIPAYVEQLTPWRHLTDTSIDGKFVRVARIQINYTFSVTYPNYETITIEWGSNNRTKNIATLTDPKTAWHKVTSGTFVSADNVYEPDVYAILPREVLGNGVFNGTRSLPIDSSVSATRDDPYTMDATDDYPGFLEYDHSIKNFFYSIINEDDPRVTTSNQCNYKTSAEPWLYDRSSAMFSLYMKSGFLKALREAVRSTQFYKNHIWPGTTTPERTIGLFDLKCPDVNGWAGGNGAMYSYNECFAYNYWLTGDDDVLDHIKWVNSAHEVNDEPTRWSPSLGTWTERHTAFRLLSNVIAYEVFGEYSYSKGGKTWNVKSNITSQTGDFIWHQNGAGGLLPGNRVDGALYHYGSQHGDGQSSVLVASTWMSALTCNAMVRAYFVSQDNGIANFIRRLGAWEKAVLKHDSNHIYDGYGQALWYPAYMVRWDGVPDYADGGDGSEIEHSIELADTIAWGGYFADMLGYGDQSYYQKASDLYYSYNKGVNHWIRPAGPASGNTAYRVTPWRKYGWEYRTTGSFSWLMGQIPGSGGSTPTPTPTPTPDIPDGALLSKISFSAGTYLLDPDNTGNLTIEFDVVPLENNIDGVIGYADSSTTIDAFSKMPIKMRMNQSGHFDALDATSYKALNIVNYTAGTEYHVRIVTDLAQKTSDIFVTPEGGSEVMIADDYRYNTTPIDDLGKLGLISELEDEVFYVINHTVYPTGGSTPTPPPLGENLVLNPGFEDGLLHWGEDWGNNSLSTTYPHSGTYSIRIGKGGGRAQLISGFTGGMRVVLEAWGRADAAGSYGSIGVDFLDGNGVRLPGGKNEVIVDSTQYKKYTLDLTTLPGTEQIHVWLWGSNGYLYGDDFVLRTDGEIEPTPTPPPEGEIIIFENTQNFTPTSSGVGTLQVVQGEGVDGTACIKYTNLQLWKTPPALDFSANPIDISSLDSNDKLQISVDHGNCLETNRYVFVYFNGQNDSAHRVNTGYLDKTAGYQTITMDIGSIRANLGNSITQVGFSAGNGWSSTMTFWVDNIKFIREE